MSDQVQREEQSTSNSQTTPTQGESGGASGSAMRTQLRAMDFSSGAAMLSPRAPVQKKGPPQGPPAPVGRGAAEEESEERQEEQPGGGDTGGGPGGGPEEGGPERGAQQEREGAENENEERTAGAPGERVDVNAPEAEVSGALTTLAEEGANEQQQGAPGGGANVEQTPDAGSQVAPLEAAAPVADLGNVEVDAEAGAQEEQSEEVAEGGDVEGGEVVVAPAGGGDAPAPEVEGGGAHAAAGPAAQPIVPPAVSGGLFVPRSIPPLFAAMPPALEAHNVAGVIGNDPQTGAAIFTGSINQSAAEEQPENEAVPVSQSTR